MSKYEVDEENFRMALEDIRKNHSTFNNALGRGWKPDFQKAIETWHTACLDLGIGEGYVEHILEEHPEDDIIWRIESVLEQQVEEFLAGLEEDAPDKDADILANVKARILRELEGLTPDEKTRVLSKLIEVSQTIPDAAQE